MKQTILKYILIILVISFTNKAIGQTELYKQYEHLEDVVVACVMNFPIDTIKVEVTILKPQTKEAVYYLVEEFNLGIEKDTIYKRLESKRKYGHLLIRNVQKDDPTKSSEPIKTPDDYKNISLLVYNYNKGVILVFHNIETKERRRKINTFLINKAKESDTLPNIKSDSIYK